MINNKDNLGNELTKEQMDYFKDTKIVDSNNNLLVCYHGSPNPGFKEFNPKDSKSQFGKYKFGNHNVNYFTTDRKSASTYTEFGYDDGTIFECYINIVNPYIVDNKSEAEIKSHLNIKDDRLREQQIKLFDRIFNKWKGKILDYSDFRFNELNNRNNYMNDISLTSKNIYRPFNNYMSELDQYYNLNKERNEIKKHKNKSFIEKRKLRIYKENIDNLKELLEKERMKKRINRSLYHNLFLNIKKDINNFIEGVNKSFQKKYKMIMD